MSDSPPPSEFPAPKPTVGLEAAERQLLSDLSDAVKLIERKQAREGIIGALQGVIWFLNDRGVSGQQIWPLEYLRKELEFIFQGKRSPILQPGVNSREDVSAVRYFGPAKEEIRIFAAACSEAVYQLGQRANLESFPKRTRGDVDRFVAGKVSKWPSFDSGTCSPSAIKSWRVKLGKREGVQHLVTGFMNDDAGRHHLNQILKEGPRHVGGF
ncbi:MAG: hypothetical protein BGO03_03550 [Mesorhizobium sp. 61-13]|nr:MAG: hypothetical protein BGO03_03550 [Mesorhizobium sp. 61-13]